MCETLTNVPWCFRNSASRPAHSPSRKGGGATERSALSVGVMGDIQQWTVGGLGKVSWGRCPASSQAPSPQPRHRWALTELSTRRKTQAAPRSQSHGGPTQHPPAESRQRQRHPNRGPRSASREQGAAQRQSRRPRSTGSPGPTGSLGLEPSGPSGRVPAPRPPGTVPAWNAFPPQAWARLPSEARLPSTMSLAPGSVPGRGPHDPPPPVSCATRGGLLLRRQRDKRQPSTAGLGWTVQASPGPGLWSSARRGLGAPARASEPGTAPARLGEEGGVTSSKQRPVAVTESGLCSPSLRRPLRGLSGG